MEKEDTQIWERILEDGGELRFTLEDQVVTITAVKAIKRGDREGVPTTTIRTGMVKRAELSRAQWSFTEGDNVGVGQWSRSQFWINIQNGKTEIKPEEGLSETHEVASGNIRLDITSEGDRAWLTHTINLVLGLISVM